MKLLILDYLQTKMNQATKDAEMFALMIQEIKELTKENKNIKIGNDFLKIVSTKDEN